MLLRDIFYSFDPRTRLLIRKLLYLPLDLFTKPKKLVPPKGLIFTGAGDFEKIGDKFAQKIIEECKLPKNASVLDIGSGIGRVARPLAAYLTSDGKYEGFDIVPGGVNWCKHHYRAYANFTFLYIPLRNDLYNLETSESAATFRFPYNDNLFDAAFSISVFTHMQLNDVQHYFNETARVLKAGGSCLCTFFLITVQRLEKNAHNINKFFKHNCGDFYLHDNRVKDANIAFTLETVQLMASNAGLAIVKIEYGWWADKDQANGFDFQDIVVLRKTA